MPLLTPASGLDSDPNMLADRLSSYADALRACMNDLFDVAPGLEPFYGMMAYHLGWIDENFQPNNARAGKNLRPSLCILLGEALGAAPVTIIPFAAGIELLHNFSLIHDDIQDQSPTRRGRPTVWTLWSPAQAINAGDGMFSLAHLAWLRSDLAERDARAFTAIVRSLELTILRLCEGQYLDMSGEGSLDISSDAYVRMIGRKTAALIGEAAWVGARTATSDGGVLDAARTFGHELGIAFQIRDDVLGIWGDEQKTGKSASSDIATRKMTLPIIVALESASSAVRDELRMRYGSAPSADSDQRIRELLDMANAEAISTGQEERHWQSAMQALDDIPMTMQWREAIRSYARSFVGRRE
jgi:geranylgeranyl diphosphate synthase type I